MAGNTDNILINSAEIEQLLDAMADDCSALIARQSAAVSVIGIHTGGAWVAAALHQRLKLDTALGSLNASYHRDDYERVGLKTGAPASVMPVSLQDQCVLLVDDVIHTGRTVRAAINQVFEHGRPQSIHLIALCERPGRELPIQPDIVGRAIDCDAGQRIRLHGPDPLELHCTGDTA